jgi:hypothetical protein
MGEGWRIELAMMGVWAVGRFRAWVLTFAMCVGCALALSGVLRIPARGMPDCAKPGEVPQSGGCVRAPLSGGCSRAFCIMRIQEPTPAGACRWRGLNALRVM